MIFSIVPHQLEQHFYYSLCGRRQWTVYYCIYQSVDRLQACYHSTDFSRFCRFLPVEVIYNLFCILKICGRIPLLILVIALLFDSEQYLVPAISLGIEYIIHLSFFLIVDHYQRRKVIDLAKQGVFGHQLEKVWVEYIVNLHKCRQFQPI